MKISILKSWMCLACLLTAFAPLNAQTNDRVPPQTPESADVAAGVILARQAIENSRDQDKRDWARQAEQEQERLKTEQKKSLFLNYHQNSEREREGRERFGIPAQTNQIPTLNNRFNYPRTLFNSKAAVANQENNQAIGQLVKKMKDAESDESRKKVKDELNQLLSDQYDAYLEQHEKPLKQLEERLKTLRQEFEKRKQAKDDLVKLRLDTIWYNALGLNWPSNGNSTWPNVGGSAFSRNQPNSSLNPNIRTEQRRPFPVQRQFNSEARPSDDYGDERADSYDSRNEDRTN